MLQIYLSVVSESEICTIAEKTLCVQKFSEVPDMEIT